MHDNHYGQSLRQILRERDLEWCRALCSLDPIYIEKVTYLFNKVRYDSCMVSDDLDGLLCSE